MNILSHHAKYYNRELSWILFNQRVLEEACNLNHPLLERLKFLSIFSSNLDEFFMIRVAGLKDQIEAQITNLSPDGLTAQQQILKIAELLHPLVEKQSKILQEQILPELRKHKIRLRHYSALNDTQKQDLKEYFYSQVFPVLTPLAVDPAHPFPPLNNLGLNILVILKGSLKEDRKIAVVQVPRILPRFVPIHTSSQHYDFILMEHLIEEHIDTLFPNMKVVSVEEFKVTRNSDMEISEAEADDLLKLIEKELRKRRLGTVVRLEVSKKIDTDTRAFLKDVLVLEEHDIYDIDEYLNINDFMELVKLDIAELKDPPFMPAPCKSVLETGDIFEAIKKQDIILHHPYDSFNVITDLVKAAANDPNVLAIKQTLYRTGGANSPIVQALKEAAINGIQVSVLIELKARFDENHNITWAEELKMAGANVVYGLLGLKTHCKVLMIVRQEGNRIVRYVHIGTGNYNVNTGKLYTDISILTCQEEIGNDVTELFNLLTGYSKQEAWRMLAVAPINIRQTLLYNIQEAANQHTPEQPSIIRAVLNALVDTEIIDALYMASQKGVKISLVVRGICCLKAGIPGLSENITVKSILGRYLEHSRITHFKYANTEKIFIGSADWMPRNLNKRIEVLLLVKEKHLSDRLKHILDIMIADNVQSYILQNEGFYVKSNPKNTEKRIHAQEIFMNEAIYRTKQINNIL
jgi:polyphosphate kinase